MEGHDQNARDLANRALAKVEVLEHLLEERKFDSERRWGDGQSAIQRIVERMESAVKDLQSSYREGFVALRDEALRHATDLRNDLDPRLTRVEAWLWRAAIGIIIFLTSCTISLIGVVYFVAGHK